MIYGYTTMPDGSQKPVVMTGLHCLGISTNLTAVQDLLIFLAVVFGLLFWDFAKEESKK